ncbi:MAG: exonuclease SbcCD subunit D [Clostridia bacterium]|nr:exonuclease SbcCD subunit D [Clostridia bacterium]
MNFLHVSDLHIGKKLCGKALRDDQRHILAEILEMAAAPEIDAVLVAGDLYDKPQPSGEAVELVGIFLTELAKLGKPCFIVSGNHDSPEQVAYCERILSGASIFVSPAFNAAPARHVLRDEFGELHLYLLPFVRPMQVRRAFPERAAEIRSYADAVRVAVEEMHIDPAARNVLVAHQFVVGATAPELTDSEERMVGGVDAVPAEVFDGFDYVALGHLHAPQRVRGERVRYAGSPLKYSLSEERQRKAALKVHLGAKGEDGASLEVEKLPYHPLRDVRSLRGTLAELTADAGVCRDYVFVTLTDELPPLDPVGSLLQSYPNLVQRRMENSRTGGGAPIPLERVEEKSPLEHFVHFFRAQNNGQEPNAAQMALLRRVVEEAEVNRNATH